MFLQSTRFCSLILVKTVFSGHMLDIRTKQGKMQLCLLKINGSGHASLFISKRIIGNVESNIHYGFKI